MINNKGFVMLAISSGLMLVTMGEMNSILKTFYKLLNSDKDKNFAGGVALLYDICSVTGVFTFGVSVYGGLNLTFAYKVIFMQFLLIYALQAGAMIAASEIFLIVTNIYDGLFRGGLIFVVYEATAELAYPVGESLSLGFVYALHMPVRFMIQFILGMLTYTDARDPDKKQKLQEELLPAYIAFMVLFFINTVVAIFLLFKYPLVMKRSVTDACLELQSDILTEEETE